MDRLPPMSKEAVIQVMRSKVEQVLGAVADAVHDAPTGAIASLKEGRLGKTATSSTGPE